MNVWTSQKLMLLLPCTSPQSLIHSNSRFWFQLVMKEIFLHLKYICCRNKWGQLLLKRLWSNEVRLVADEWGDLAEVWSRASWRGSILRIIFWGNQAETFEISFTSRYCVFIYLGNTVKIEFSLAIDGIVLWVKEWFKFKFQSILVSSPIVVFLGVCAKRVGIRSWWMRIFQQSFISFNFP